MNAVKQSYKLIVQQYTCLQNGTYFGAKRLS